MKKERSEARFVSTKQNQAGGVLSGTSRPDFYRKENIMQKYFDINEGGFSIRCKIYFQKDIRAVKNIVIATYGFGGNKDNKASEKFADRIIGKYRNYAVICFDWPCHGKDARNKLILDECLTYLRLVGRYAREELGAEHLYNYSSSLGAYLTLLLLAADGTSEYERMAFRCPALRMYDSFAAGITEDDWDKLRKGKEILRGYDRKIKITQEFLDSLKENDVMQKDYLDYADQILMIHGTKDEMAPISVTEEFCENNVVELIPVENADHPFSNPDYMDFAIGKIIEFFAPESK